MIKDTTSSWGVVSRLLHWAVGIAIVAMIAYGWWMNHIPARPDRFFHRSIHADIGYTIMVLMALRLLWRLVNPTPAFPSDAPRWQRVASRINEGLLYLITFVVCLLGWAHSGAHKPDYASYFGLFRVPQFTTEDRALAGVYEDRHILMAYVLLALVALHVVAAVWHQFVRKDGLISRMVGRA